MWRSGGSHHGIRRSRSRGEALRPCDRMPCTRSGRHPCMRRSSHRTLGIRHRHCTSHEDTSRSSCPPTGTASASCIRGNSMTSAHRRSCMFHSSARSGPPAHCRRIHQGTSRGSGRQFAEAHLDPARRESTPPPRASSWCSRVCQDQCRCHTLHRTHRTSRGHPCTSVMGRWRRTCPGAARR